MNATPVWALFFLSPLTPLLDYFFKGRKFEWKKTSSELAVTNLEIIKK